MNLRSPAFGARPIEFRVHDGPNEFRVSGNSVGSSFSATAPRGNGMNLAELGIGISRELEIVDCMEIENY